MLKNLRASSNALFTLALFFVFCRALAPAQETRESPAQEALESPAGEMPEASAGPPVTRWYRSNAAGMTLELVPSRSAALRNEYSLSVRAAGPEALLEVFRPYYDPLFLIEIRALYEKGKEIRRQWIFRDSRGRARFNASGSIPGADGSFPGGDGEGEKRGFIEVYNEDGFITEDRQFNGDGSESLVRFFYNQDTLARAETRIKEAPAGEATAEDEAAAQEAAAQETAAETDEDGYILTATDFYRYTRSRSLRAIERLYHTAAAEDTRNVLIAFPSINPGFSRDVVFIDPGIAYSSEFLQDVITPAGGRIIYTTESRGRVLSEQRLDEEENVLAEIRNTWSGDRLSSVLYISDGDERLIEYEYGSDGSRTVERNYNKGALERVIRSEKGKDVEELYMNGELILRAVWEDGRKVSEERVRAPRETGSPR